MSTGSLMPQVERLFSEGTVAGLPESALLERFLSRRDELAFAALVARHGPLVLGVCRRLLRDPSDVDDAFQTTFLVLVRKASSIRQRELLGPWLYGVAFRVATRARIIRTRQREHERGQGAIEPAAVDVDPVWCEVAAVLDEELERLPEKYRLPLVLCYFEGLTHDETAFRLGCPVGTVRSRLARGRERLSRRLTRRGLAPATGLLGASLAAQVSATLVSSTSQAAARIAAGSAVATTVSSTSAALLEGVIRSMIWNPWRKGALAVTALGVILAGTVFSAQQATGDPPRHPARTTSRDPSSRPAPARKGQKAVQRPIIQPLPKYVVQPPDNLIVEVLEALQGRPISGERLVGPDGRITLGFYGDVYVAGLTVPEIKEKVVLHLRKYLNDETLGLTAADPKDPDKTVAVPPRDSDRVYVDVAAYNSAVYYVVGEAAVPGRFPVTGSETVLDAINHAHGLLRNAAPHQVRLIRPGSAGKPDEIMPIDYEEISAGTDPSTNYQMLPGDRLVITTGPKKKPEPADDSQLEAEIGGELRRLERRLDRLEDKLDQVLDALKAAPAEPRPSRPARNKER